MNHGIVTLSQASPPARLARNVLAPKTSFIQRYVFPDGELVTPAEMLRYAEGSGLETRDLESLREHYALTLRRWVGRLEDRRDEARRLAGARTYRTWRLYLSGSARAFTTGRIGVVQALFSRTREGGQCELPLTRADLYQKCRPEENGGTR